MVKRRDLNRHLERHGCHRLRQGAKHEIWSGPTGRSTVPRHREIPRTTARVNCGQLGIRSL